MAIALLLSYTSLPILYVVKRRRYVYVLTLSGIEISEGRCIF